MREFLYKVWHKELKQYSDEPVELGDTYAKFSLNDEKVKLLPLKSNKLIKLLYTQSVDDVNNEMLFEGDIVEVLEYVEHKKMYRKHITDITWYEDGFVIMDYADDYYSMPLSSRLYGEFSYPACWMRKIGSRYTHPELYEQLQRDNRIQ